MSKLNESSNKKFFFKNFSEFYPFYLSQHANDINRLFHYIGTFITLIIYVYVGFTLNFVYLFYAPIMGYGFAWFGHYFFEKNKPATFKYPFFSLAADYVMFTRFVLGKTFTDFNKYNIKNIKNIPILYI